MTVRVPNGEAIALDGVPGVIQIRRGREREFATAVVSVASGDQYKCVWWNAANAPAEGQRVALRGSGTAIGEVRIVTTTVIDGVLPPTEHRLLDYYRSCMEADQRDEATLSANSLRILPLSFAGDPFGAPRISLGKDARAKRWKVAREVAGQAESIRVGYPIVLLHETDGVTRVLPILRADAALLGHELVLQAGSLEIDNDFLASKGVTEEARNALVSETAETPVGDMTARSQTLLARLEAAGLLETDIEHQMIAIASTHEYSGFIKRLVQEFEELKALSVSSLRSGPLGILLGSELATDHALLEPMPCVVMSNVEQELAVQSAISNTWTVVTGPPGTGKSQVLTNAVAAALARGERVLLASKNNHAIDVVTERVAQAHPDAHVVRLGRRDLIGPAASGLLTAMHRTPSEGRTIDQAKHAWGAHIAGLQKPYQALAERSRLAAAIADLTRDLAERTAALPTGIRPLKSAEETDHLLIAQQRARAAWTEFANCGTGFWKRGRSRRLQQRAVAETNTAINLTSSAVALRELLVRSTGPDVVQKLGDLVVLGTMQIELDRIQLEFDLLPGAAGVEEEMLQSYAPRIDSALTLFGAGWRWRLHSIAAPRAAVMSYQAALSDAATQGGSAVYRARDLTTTVLDALPVFAVTSLAVGAAVPLRSGLFDLVIIDEASQSDVPSAIPLLFRAKRAMIVGDPNQLKHITTVGTDRDSALAQFHQIDDSVARSLGYSATNLFAAAASVAAREPIFLHRHYRSHPRIAEFASHHFYGGSLQIETDPNNFLPGEAVQWIDVAGDYRRGPFGRSAINMSEISKVLIVLEMILGEVIPLRRSVGVVAPFRAHVDHLLNEIARTMPDTASSVTVDVAYGFQGDERDVIIFSPCVSRDMPAFLQRVSGDPHLLNVAITRARARLVVVGDRAACLESGTALADLATYAR